MMWAHEASVRLVDDTDEAHQALADFPASVFADELVAAYLEAKVILLSREEDAWFQSIMTTLWHQYNTYDPGEEKSGMRLLAEKFHCSSISNDFPANGKEYFRQYYQHVRKELSQRGIEALKYEVEKGWEPLCDFLRVNVPVAELPRSEDWSVYKGAHANVQTIQ